MKVTMGIDNAVIKANGPYPHNQKVRITFEDGSTVLGYVTSLEIEHSPYEDYYPYHHHQETIHKAFNTQLKMPDEFYSSPLFKSSISQHDTLEILNAAIPNLEKTKAWCPECDPSPTDTLVQIIVHLNDVHHWPREQIADWLEKTGQNLPITTQPEGEVA